VRFGSILLALLATATATHAQDARTSLRAGATDAGIAVHNMELLATRPRPEGFADPDGPGELFSDLLIQNTDVAFKGNLLFLGSFTGFQIWDIADPRNPKLRTGFLCPGGQGDVSIHGNLLFMSVEMPNGRIDCKEGGFTQGPSAERFMGVRIFDVSDVAKPKQVAAVQTCRGSHTHTLVPDANDPAHVYIYVSGVQGVRSDKELAGCSGGPPESDPNTALFRIDVIKVPVAAPQNAAIVSTPRIFADSAGNIAGLWRGGKHGEGTQTTDETSRCHDITVYPKLGLAAGACAGNGILLDISDPANPKRIAEVSDPNFAFWHSATFNNDGTKVLFTDEWGGGTVPRCLATDKREWGADAIFDLVKRKLQHASYYKLPAAQTALENCVAHNGSLLPVPGRDIMIQGWYQGGISVFDFTDSRNPVEIAYFDRGPLAADSMRMGGVWGGYWYNGYIYSPEMARGLDILQLTPSEHLSQNEIDAAKLVQFDVFNPQTQPRITWPVHVTVARAYLDQLRRSGGVPAERLNGISGELDRAERSNNATQKRSSFRLLAADVTQIGTGARPADARLVALLAQTLRELGK
jgi:hypothetical protein